MSWNDQITDVCKHISLYKPALRLVLVHAHLPAMETHRLPLFCVKSQWSAAGGRHTEISLQEMQHTRIQSVFLHVHIVLKRRRPPGRSLLQKAAVQREAHGASGVGREGCRGRDGNYLSLASSCQPLSGFRSSATLKRPPLTMWLHLDGHKLIRAQRSFVLQ